MGLLRFAARPRSQVVAIARESGDEVDYARTLEPLDYRTRQDSEAVLARARSWTRPTAIIRALDIVGRPHQTSRRPSGGGCALPGVVGDQRAFRLDPRQAEALMQLAIIQTVQGELSRAKQTAVRAQEAILQIGDAHDLRFGIPHWITCLPTAWMVIGLR